MRRCVVQVRSSRRVAASVSVARRYLHDIARLSRYEPKVSAVEVTPASSTAGTYRARGWFLCLPWSGRFTYRITADGFTSRMIEGPALVTVSGGFRVERVDARSCRIVHVERYELPAWLAPLRPLLRALLAVLLRRELSNIDRGIASR